MVVRADPNALVSTAAGVAVALGGLVIAGVGLWGRRETRRALAHERIAAPANAARSGAYVTSAPAARSMAEFIRQNTLEATGGRTYAETDPYLDDDGKPTSARARAAKDQHTWQPVENPDHDLWIQSTTLRAGLMQAYVAFRLSELTVALGALFVVTGIGLAARGQRCSPR